MKEHFVADGRRRARRSPEYLTAVAMIRFDVAAEFEPLFAQAGFFGKMRLRYQRRRRIEREIGALAPSDAYYMK